MSTYGKALILAATRQVVKSECGTPLSLVESETTPGRMYKVAYEDREMIRYCKALECRMTDPCKHILSAALIKVV
jgi:hypothetical protein